jgi:hypothetical protein
MTKGARVDRLRAIKTRAAAINVPLKQLCDARSIDATQVQHWLSGKHDPRLTTYETVCAALEEELGQRETDLMGHLRALYPNGLKR